jgi:hypothetical protein
MADMSRIKAKNKPATSSWMARGVPTPIIFRSSSAESHPVACSSNLFCALRALRTAPLLNDGREGSADGRLS